MSHLEEKTINSQVLFEGRIIKVQIDEVSLPNGNTSTRELVKHPGAVSILAITEEEKIVLVRQYRKPLEKAILEIPAGKIDPGENPQHCAKRELEEETGYLAQEMDEVLSFYTSPGFSDEIVYIYEAKKLTQGEAKPDADEFVETVELTLTEALEKISSHEIHDAKTVTAIYYWQNQLLLANEKK
ncbi:NUDIX hydrolase [Mechercharimyces sp. CAU 1602]|nr:NUDIX hydrolase [Mechercharimyces sp. CAU 1602]